jgi:hypothetical protein
VQGLQPHPPQSPGSRRPRLRLPMPPHHRPRHARPPNALIMLSSCSHNAHIMLT